MKEADFNTLLGHWTSAHKEELGASIFEGKLCRLDKKKSIGAYDFEDHQLPLLRAAEGEGFWYKFPDLGMQTPCDGMFFKGDGYVALYWWKPRKVKRCTLIRIGDLDKFFTTVTKKSIRQEEAEKIAFRIIDF
jgi:hypothetical protein